MGKKEIYASYGIEYKNGKINVPMFGWMSPLLVNGNAKLGKGVWTWSTLPGTEEYSVDGMKTCGTCNCDCKGCYAKTGFYRMKSTIKALAIRTILVREYPDFVKNAIIAQIKAENIKLCRIHASGDFFSVEYVEMWKAIVKACASCIFWSYTKNAQAENAFDGLKNCNIVKSVIPGYGVNFGHCEYVMDMFHALKAAGKQVHICKCGFDKNQHCVNCKGCSENEYVLFVEHSTNYNAEKDEHFAKLAEIVNA